MPKKISPAAPSEDSGLEPDQPLEKSKSQLKREMEALQKLGEELIKLPLTQLEQVPLPEPLLDAVTLARRLKNREGLRRQMQYIGKLMRVADSEAIDAKLDCFRKDGEAYRQHFHRIEKWRDDLIAHADSAITALIKESPTLDRQHLRQLVRQAQRELTHNKPPAASRKIFKYLRDNLER